MVIQCHEATGEVSAVSKITTAESEDAHQSWQPRAVLDHVQCGRHHEEKRKTRMMQRQAAMTLRQPSLAERPYVLKAHLMDDKAFIEEKEMVRTIGTRRKE